MPNFIQRMVRFYLYFQFLFFGTCLINPLFAKDLDRWTLGVGVAVISDNDTTGAVSGQFKKVNGDSGGWIYNINLGYILKKLSFSTDSNTYTPHLEIVSSLGFVDENTSDLFYNFNAAFAGRWIDFPWNRYLSTTIMTGIGLNYSEKIFKMDVEKHPDDDRSHLKFFWPVELTLAIPGFKHHCLVFFSHHISGGYIMDSGGIDSFGVGYRYLFH